VKQLVPSFSRSTIKVLLMLLACIFADWLWNAYHDHKWWPSGYVVSMAIPLTLFPLAMWFMFVPREMAYSDEELVLKTWPASRFQMPWTELKLYGPGEGTFMLLFEGRQAFQIAGVAFPQSDWQEFTEFLSKRYPDKLASGEICGKLFRWRN
jgi:hypothetical protein